MALHIIMEGIKLYYSQVSNRSAERRFSLEPMTSLEIIFHYQIIKLKCLNYYLYTYLCPHL